MIIYLDWNDDQVSSVPSVELDEVVTRLVKAERDGDHLLVVNPDSAERLLKLGDFGGWVRSTLIDVLQKFSQRMKYIKEKKYPYLIISSVSSQEIDMLSSGNIIVGYRKLSQSKILDRPIFLLEGPEVDGFVFDAYIDIIKRRLQMGELSYQKRSGGGGSTWLNLKNYMKEFYIIVCVCDSDRITPFSGKGDTARAVDQGMRQEGCKLSVFCITPNKEVENFIPFSIARQLFESDKDSERKISKLENLLIQQEGSTLSDCMWSFYDTKKGVRKKKLLAVETCDRANPWIRKKYKIERFDEICDDEYPMWGEDFIKRIHKNEVVWKNFLRGIEHDKNFNNYMEWFLNFIPRFISSESKIT